MTACWRTYFSLALAIVFILCSLPVSAQTTTGTLSGTVTGDKDAPLAGVAISAISPSQRYSTTTNAQGFFSLTGIVPDTYVVTYTAAGYQVFSLPGVTVSIGQAVAISEHLQRTLKTIGGVSARSQGSAFQPQQTQDTYTVGTQQMSTILGKNNATSESSLLAAIPGASFDSSGYPVLRGGRENEEGFQFEGIPYVDPFTNQFVNSLTLNGAAQFQVTPGAGDASNGNAGTGAINIVAKRGTNPPFGQLEGDVYAGRSQQFARAEYGYASPTGKISTYTAFQRDHTGSVQYGPGGSDALLLGRLYAGRNNQLGTDFIENAVYRFGKDNSQSFQFFYE
ncbi:MAG: TonB-dependent receptor plug, partial [Candidatus Eremiobacteraeota bacterium]|nr:TonB-dependent receptor plug [Candidatus Eremiobacteraeota bacterium]